MKKVIILPVSADTADTSYCAVADGKQSVGRTAGEALDFLTGQFSDDEPESLVIVRKLQPDRFFNADQQKQLGDLMSRWRVARNKGQTLSPDEQTRLNALVEAELQASEQRTSAISDNLGQ